MVGIEFEVNAGEADLVCSKNKVEIKILSEGLPQLAYDGAGWGLPGRETW